MPLISRLGAASSRGFGEFNQQAQANYIEDYFSTYLYNGTGADQTITNNIPLVTTASWTTYKLVKNNVTGGYGSDCKIDSNGNIYLLGMTLDGIQYTTLAKYNSSNVLQWQRKIAENNTTATDHIGIAIDSSNDVYVVTTAKDATRTYILLAKYSSAGSLQWQRKIYQDDSYSGGIAIDSSNNIYVSGLVVVGAALYGFIAKYDTSGSIQWQRSYSQGRTAFRAIAVDSSANVYAVGVINQDGTNDCISLVKYNSSGTLQWERQFTQITSRGQKIAIDSADNIYLIGYANDGTSDYAITAKYNSSGTLQWQRKIKTNNSYGYAITLDSSSNVYITGLLDNGANARPFTAKYDSSGALQWQRQFLEYGIMKGVAVTSSGDLYLAGIYSLSSVNSLCLIKLKTDGSVTAGSAILTIQLGAGTESAAGATSSTPTGTSATSTYTDAAGTATDSAGTATESSAIQAATNGSGLVWMKSRSAIANHALYDTIRGTTKQLVSNLTSGETTESTGLTAFNANGFTIGTLSTINTNAATYSSWTFRKQPKFFDVITYTGNGANRTISHNLGSVPGMIIIKRTDTTGAWAVYHNALANTEYLILNTTAAKATGATYWNSTTPTSTVFSLGTATDVNANGGTYVAYLYASNAGGFGADGSQNVISCGSFTTDASTGNATITLGYEPQLILMKDTGSVGDWIIVDNMREMSQTNTKWLFPNLSNAESTGGGTPYVVPTATGFNITNGFFGLSRNIVYMAIRRGPMRTPTDATKVFSPIAQATSSSVTTVNTGFPTDLAILKIRNIADGARWVDRLRGITGSANSPELNSSSTSAEYSTNDIYNAQQNTYSVGGVGVYDAIFWSFRRAPGFFDVVCYTGTGSARTVNHNLGVAPELMIVKRRSSAGFWAVYNTTLGPTKAIFLNENSASSVVSYWNDTSPTNLVFSLSGFGINDSGDDFVAYLFASCPGVSKVGSYTGTGATQTISCGFTGGARYVMIKRTDSTGDWWVWDTARGMISGTDPRLAYNSTAAETNANWVYTTTGGFQIVTSDATVNANGGSYIYLAIA